MSHSDVHAKTEASVANARAARQSTYDTIKKDGPAKPTTPNETQELKDCPRYSTAYKGSLTRSEIYERLMPDKKTGALRIDGPVIPGSPGGGAFMSFLSDGGIVVRTGEKTEESGPSSGILSIYTNGQVQKHLGRTDIQYNEGGTESEGQALNILAYGDVVEEAKGSTRFIKAKKIKIEATEELWLIGKTQVYIQAGSNGGGTITMNAGSIEQVCDNTKEIISGQKMTFGAGEDQKVAIDPRSNVVINSTGHLNTNVAQAYNAKIAGLVDWKVGGAYKVNAGGDASMAAGGTASVTAAGVVNIIGVGNVNIKGALILLN